MITVAMEQPEMRTDFFRSQGVDVKLSIVVLLTTMVSFTTTS